MAWVKLLCDHTKPRIMPYKILENAFKIQYFGANLDLAQERGLQFYQTRSHAVVLYDTLPAVCIEKAVMYVYYGRPLPEGTLNSESVRDVLKSNSQYGLQDPQNQDARSSWEPSSDSNSYGETCNRTVDQRIAGVPLSAVEPQNAVRENKVKRLIEKFENTQHKESFIQGLSQTQKINKFSKESQDSIARLAIA